MILYFSINKTDYGHCHSGCSVLRTTYQLGLPLIEQDALLRAKKEITYIILLFLFHYIHMLTSNTGTRHTQKVQTLYTHIHTHTPHIGCT